MPVELIAQLLGLLPSVISASEDVLHLISSAKAAVESGAAPDDPAWADIDAQLNALTARENRDPAG